MSILTSFWGGDSKHIKIGEALRSLLGNQGVDQMQF